MAKILIVEDEKPISNLIFRNLQLAGHSCRQAYDGKQALAEIENQIPDLIILDVMLPEINGFALMEYLKEIPVIFVTARDSLSDKIKGLNSGAEDYLVKPFEMQELTARINVILRRYGKNVTEFTLKGVTVDFNSRIARKKSLEIDLKPREWDLLEVLVQNKNLALSREKLLDLAWGYQFEGESRTVDVHIQKLRKKLDWEDRIKTVYKMGYRLDTKEYEV